MNRLALTLTALALTGLTVTPAHAAEEAPRTGLQIMADPAEATELSAVTEPGDVVLWSTGPCNECVAIDGEQFFVSLDDYDVTVPVADGLPRFEQPATLNLPEGQTRVTVWAGPDLATAVTAFEAPQIGDLVWASTKTAQRGGTEFRLVGRGPDALWLPQDFLAPAAKPVPAEPTPEETPEPEPVVEPSTPAGDTKTPAAPAAADTPAAVEEGGSPLPGIAVAVGALALGGVLMGRKAKPAKENAS